MANKNRTSRTGGTSGGKSGSGSKGPKSAIPVRDGGRRSTAPAPDDTSGTANYLVPGGLAVLLVLSLVFYMRARNTVPSEPAATTDSTAAAAAGSTDTPPQGAAPSQPPRRDPEPTRVAPPSQPNPPSQGEPQNVAVEATHAEPTSPDPRHGQFTIAQATEGLPAGVRLVAEIETSMGRFNCDLWPDRAPNTVANFVGLARGRRDFWDPVAGRWARRPFYDGSVFHRVIPDFMIQGGDILRSGHGDPGYEIRDENVATHDEPGLLCMANHGPNTGGAQFFILEDPKPHLNGSYSVFGRCAPIDLAERIARVPRTARDQPLTPVYIQHVTVHR